MAKTSGRVWFVTGLAVSMGAFITGWFILPSPERCFGFSCDYIPSAALLVGQHPLSWTQAIVMGAGLTAALILSLWAS
ncbi:MAG: hypothetical protein ABI635_07530 [Actinomycetota bacterium]